MAVSNTNQLISVRCSVPEKNSVKKRMIWLHGEMLSRMRQARADKSLINATRETMRTNKSTSVHKAMREAPVLKPNVLRSDETASEPANTDLRNSQM